MTKLALCAAVCLVAGTVGIEECRAQCWSSIGGSVGRSWASRHSGYRIQPYYGGSIYYYYSPRDYSNSIWRHHGMGEGGYCYSPGVKRHHGLGDGYCRPPGSSTYWWTDGTRRYQPVAPTPRARPQPRFRSGQAPPQSAPAAVPQFETSYTQTTRAWSHLAGGAARTARRDFAVLALRTPEDVNPKIGFAIASALLGEDDTAIWVMRRAFETNALAVVDIEIGAALTARIQPLIRRFGAKGSAAGGEEALFMTAALSFLAGSPDRALALALEASNRGDQHPSTRALLELLQEGPPEPAGGGDDSREGVGTRLQHA